MNVTFIGLSIKFFYGKTEIEPKKKNRVENSQKQQHGALCVCARVCMCVCLNNK